MASYELIDAQFDRAVEIVQSLPKVGPIQTDYEEKLQMYSLYKQATVGNVKSPRPGIWDMLGRAKWDAWAKHKDLDPYEAKWLYVEALLKVLRRYSDKTIAQNLVQELESYASNLSNLVLSRVSNKTPVSDTSGSTDSHGSLYRHTEQRVLEHQHISDQGEPVEEHEGGNEAEGDEARELGLRPGGLPLRRPQSSHSARHHRTPITGSFVSVKPLDSTYSVPAIQPRPAFETPSAFPAPPTISTPGSVRHPPQYDPLHPERTSPVRNIYNSAYRTHSQSVPLQPYGPIRPVSQVTLEHAVENVQAHLAALTERLELLEARSLHRSSPSSARGSFYGASYTYDGNGSGRLPARGSPRPTWDLDDLGMWSYALNPMSRIITALHKLARFFTSDQSRSPTKAIIRRLCLDLSFLVFVVVIIGAVWRRSGARRREVRAALAALWYAIVGNKAPRAVQDRGV